jgi:c-di-AMP phosphodiesterase-like protein
VLLQTRPGRGGDHVAIEPMGEDKQFLGGAVRIAGEHF